MYARVPAGGHRGHSYSAGGHRGPPLLCGTGTGARPYGIIPPSSIHRRGASPWAPVSNALILVGTEKQAKELQKNKWSNLIKFRAKKSAENSIAKI
jgi:hypothetical protein